LTSERHYFVVSSEINSAASLLFMLRETLKCSVRNIIISELIIVFQKYFVKENGCLMKKKEVKTVAAGQIVVLAKYRLNNDLPNAASNKET
jgi:hypothetical protein